MQQWATLRGPYIKRMWWKKTQESGCGGAAWWWWHIPLIFNPSTWAAEVGGSLWVFYREKYENYKGWCYSGIEHELSID